MHMTCALTSFKFQHLKEASLDYLKSQSLIPLPCVVSLPSICHLQYMMLFIYVHTQARMETPQRQSFWHFVHCSIINA